MVKLNRIYTRTGDAGNTSLGTGERRPKYDLRIHACGAIDEANSAIGLARVSTASAQVKLDEMLARIQNDLFDLGADLCNPDTGAKLEYEPLRVLQSQVDRIEKEIDEINTQLEPLNSFVLPGGSAAAAALHIARTVTRRAERVMVELSCQPNELVSEIALRYINRLSDFLFVASRSANQNGANDVLWIPGQNR